MSMMLAIAALLAVNSTSALPPSPARALSIGAQATVTVRIVRAAAVRGGFSDTPHRRRPGKGPDGAALTLIEFE